MRTGTAIAVLFALVLAAPVAAESEEQECRLTARGEAGSVAMNAFGTNTDVFAAGGGLGAAYGLRSWLEVGLDAGYLTRSDVTFSEPVIDGISRPDLDLYSNLHAITAAASARALVVGAHANRWHPFIELRSGLTWRLLTSPQVFSDIGLLSSLDTKSSWHWFAGAGAGAVYRVTDHLEVGVAARGDLGLDGHRVLGCNLELTWQTYQLF